jgi:hypothetical protein
MFMSVVGLLGCQGGNKQQTAKELAPDHKVILSANIKQLPEHKSSALPALKDCPLAFSKGLLRWTKAPKVVLFDDNGNVMKLTQQKMDILDVAMNAIKEATGKQIIYSTNADFNDTIAIFHYCGRSAVDCMVDGINVPKWSRPHYISTDFLYFTNGLSMPYVDGELVSAGTLFNKKEVKYKNRGGFRIFRSTKKQFARRGKNIDATILNTPDNTIYGAYCFVNTYQSEKIKNRLISECILRVMGLYELTDEPNSYLSVMRRGDNTYDQPLQIDSVVTGCLRALYGRKQ